MAPQLDTTRGIDNLVVCNPATLSALNAFWASLPKTPDSGDGGFPQIGTASTVIDGCTWWTSETLDWVESPSGDSGPVARRKLIGWQRAVGGATSDIYDTNGSFLNRYVNNDPTGWKSAAIAGSIIVGGYLAGSSLSGTSLFSGSAAAADATVAAPFQEVGYSTTWEAGTLPNGVTVGDAIAPNTVIGSPLGALPSLPSVPSGAAGAASASPLSSLSSLVSKIPQAISAALAGVTKPTTPIGYGQPQTPQRPGATVSASSGNTDLLLLGAALLVAFS